MKKRFPYHLQMQLLLLLSFEIVFWSAGVSLYFYLTNSVSEFRLQFPQFLYLLFILPLFSFIFFLNIRWKNLAWLNFTGQLTSRVAEPLSNIKTFLKFIFLRLALSSLLIALANPQYGKNLKQATASGVDIMIALDVSNSMMAEDMAGETDRLRIAKLAIEKLLNQLHGDRIGLVVFAGSAYTQLPITTDYAAAKLFLSSVSTNMLTSQGTAIGTAIDTCLHAFNFEEPTKKTIIVISDGENHEDDAIYSATGAAEKGVIVNTVGLGSPEGAVIPEYENGKKVGVKKDREGNNVVTYLNEKMMMDIASAGKGS
jgi:Ca-activated chloride channel family protein